MVTNSRGLIEALDISDTDGECMSDEWEDPEGDESDDTESEISVISTSSTPGTSGSSISGVPSLLEVLKAPKPAEVSRKRKTYCNTRGGKRRKTRGSSSSASEPKVFSHSSASRDTQMNNWIFLLESCFARHVEKN